MSLKCISKAALPNLFHSSQLLNLNYAQSSNFFFMRGQGKYNFFTQNFSVSSQGLCSKYLLVLVSFLRLSITYFLSEDLLSGFQVLRSSLDIYYDLSLPSNTFWSLSSFNIPLLTTYTGQNFLHTKTRGKGKQQHPNYPKSVLWTYIKHVI